MKIYVSIDLEGLPGISSLSQVAPGLSLYEDARNIMTWITNVVAKELKNNNIKEIVIADSHAFMNNIKYLDVMDDIRLIQGYPRPFSMVIGLEEGYDAAMFIGYHAAAGTPGGFLDHTYSSRTIYRLYINDIQASEYLLNALYAGELGIPVALVAGDERLKEQVKKFTPETIFVSLKRGYARIASEYITKNSVEKLLKEGIKEAVKKMKEGLLKPLTFEKYDIKIELREAVYADMVQIIPGARRIDAYSIEYNAKNAKEALAFAELVAWIGSAGAYMIKSMSG